MFIAKTDTYKYLGYHDNFYQFCNKQYPDTLIFTKDAKLIDKENDIVFFLKEGGVIEPSYAAVKNKPKELVDKAQDALFAHIKDTDLYSISKNS